MRGAVNSDVPGSSPGGGANLRAAYEASERRPIITIMTVHQFIQVRVVFGSIADCESAGMGSTPIYLTIFLVTEPTSGKRLSKHNFETHC